MSNEKTTRVGPLEFIRQVRAEMRKVTWPSRHETTVSVIAVFVMVFVASFFMYCADQLIALIFRLVMGMGF